MKGGNASRRLLARISKAFKGLFSHSPMREEREHGLLKKEESSRGFHRIDWAAKVQTLKCVGHGERKQRSGKRGK